MSGELEAGLTAALDDALATLAAALPGSTVVPRVLALGWTTVELERAEATLRAALGEAIGTFRDVSNDDLVGGRCRLAAVRVRDDPRIPSIVALEPATEGRLAATLARLGEGPAITWLAGPVSARPGEATPWSAPAAGPFGTERLLLGGPREGPYLLVVDDAPGTIAT